ncbi:uncharacterized protein EDB93DRAFT_877274 [Suillus bovinus]|uniref:uncharacterized protein n=1 Tax=Suillus bovinus TaxID=48563 RepID=UPI001B88073A|nr:uncharacterized protein EDB93DRAFT_877274 [Suillus bovinus]KAG2156944.1 hypothetical protein EDB93DRAFT_877274 [Suillus bovinus]
MYQGRNTCLPDSNSAEGSPFIFSLSCCPTVSFCGGGCSSLRLYHYIGSQEKLVKMARVWDERTEQSGGSKLVRQHDEHVHVLASVDAENFRESGLGSNIVSITSIVRPNQRRKLRSTLEIDVNVLSCWPAAPAILLTLVFTVSKMSNSRL